VTINGCIVTITSAWWLSQTVLLELSFYLKWDLWYIILAKWGPSDWSAYCFALSISDGAFFGNVWPLFGFCAWCRACLPWGQAYSQISIASAYSPFATLRHESPIEWSVGACFDDVWLDNIFIPSYLSLEIACRKEQYVMLILWLLLLVMSHLHGLTICWITWFPL
jgi:hypothetical protein